MVYDCATQGDVWLTAKVLAFVLTVANGLFAGLIVLAVTSGRR